MRPNKIKHLNLLEPETACSKCELKTVHSDITEIQQLCILQACQVTHYVVKTKIGNSAVA